MGWPIEGLEFFMKEEFDHADMMDISALRLLDEIRRRSKTRLKVTSDYRSQEEHETIYPDPATRPNSPHPRRTAIDFKPVPYTPRNRLIVLAAITSCYVDGLCPSLGLEIADRHFHIDLDTNLVRPWLWTGKSK